jgi:hypothetical protein
VCPPTGGRAPAVAAPRLPSGFTGKRLRPSCWESQRVLPSGENVGPSWPTVLFVSFWFTPAALPTVQTSLYVDRSKTCRTTDRSVLVAARKRPSGLTAELMNLPYWVSRRSPMGFRIWLSETWIPAAYSVPTWL